MRGNQFDIGNVLRTAGRRVRKVDSTSTGVRTSTGTRTSTRVRTGIHRGKQEKPLFIRKTVSLEFTGNPLRFCT